MTKGVAKHSLRQHATPSDVFDILCGDQPYALWLDHHGERGTGVSYLALGEPLELSTHWRDEVRASWKSRAVAPGEGSIPLGVHLVLPYELGLETLGLEIEGEAIPRALVVTRLLEVVHDTGEITAYWLPDTPNPEAWVASLERDLDAYAPPPAQTVSDVSDALWRDSATRYLDMISLAQRFIADGDAYQLCVTTQLTLVGSVDPVALHRVMREHNPTHHQALIRFPDIALVSSSPETFLSVSTEGVITTRPIKGTRPRGATPHDDAALREELLTSDKERAENLMIVDLMRNDLSRVCETGSVSVPELLVVETYATVHQLVSTITGNMRHGFDLVDILDATFPAGSMTGAPKKRALEILRELEGHPRGLYSGTYGVWRADGSAEFAMTIRCAMVTENSLTLGVGGGITALSEPAEEIREVGIKAHAFLRALGAKQVGYS